MRNPFTTLVLSPTGIGLLQDDKERTSDPTSKQYEDLH